MANDPRTTDVVGPLSKGHAVLRAQILLDRMSFSPGEIDAAYGPNLRAAIRGFRTAHQLPAGDELGPDMWNLLNADSAPALIEYDILPEDVAGPFQRIPADLMQQSKLQSLGFESSLELLGEKFHVSPKLFWDGDPKHTQARLAAGPNNPVGLVWIELSKPHYGIHGTPRPSQVGHTQSHGCIRLTNWDALRLAGMVRSGMAVAVGN